METECIQFELALQSGKARKVVVRNDGAVTSSDGGLVILSRIEQRRRWVRRLATCFQDRREPGRTTFPVETLLRQVVFGLAQGYEDLVDRYKKLVAHEDKLRRLLVEIFLESQETEPEQVVLDFDSSDIPLHGEQEGRFFHGYYDEYCYLPLFCFCGQWPLLVELRTADHDGASGVLEALQWMIPGLSEPLDPDQVVEYENHRPGRFWVLPGPDPHLDRGSATDVLRRGSGP